jgi:DUF177 domain-containing protein
MPSDPSQSIYPLRLAKSSERIEGTLQIDSFERLQSIILEKGTELNYSLSFGSDESGTCVIECVIDTQLIFECQRCFKPVKIDIHSDTLLGVANDKDEFEALAKEYEPLQLVEDCISIQELVEDELLLAIPISPLHPENECLGKNVLDKLNADAKPNPFAALAALKKK